MASLEGSRGGNPSLIERKEIAIIHPVVKFLDQNTERIAEIREGSITVGRAERQAFIRRAYASLAEPLIDAGSYTLEPDDLKLIWEKAFGMSVR